MKRNELGLLLAQRACCHAPPEAIWAEGDDREVRDPPGGTELESL